MSAPAYPTDDAEPTAAYWFWESDRVRFVSFGSALEAIADDPDCSWIWEALYGNEAS